MCDHIIGCTCAVQQWVFIRYAVLATMKRAELMDMLQRRHELAMACVAREYLDTTEITQDSKELQQTKQQGQSDSSSNTLHGEDAATLEPASFELQRNESFKEWVERLCRTLPAVLRSSPYKASIMNGESGKRVKLDRAVRPVPKVHRLVEENLVLADTNRVAYHKKLPYAQFVCGLPERSDKRRADRVTVDGVHAGHRGALLSRQQRTVWFFVELATSLAVCGQQAITWPGAVLPASP
jgi:hypothetical protein